MTPPSEATAFASMITFIQATQRAAEQDLEGTGVSPAQFFVLKTLHPQRSANQVDLASALGVTAGNISQLLAKLEHAGLIQRTGQGRAKLASLTREGERLVMRLKPKHQAFLRRQFASLTTAELATLSTLLAKLQQGVPQKRSSPDA